MRIHQVSRYLVLCVLIGSSFSALSQNVLITNDTATVQPDSSAVLDLSSSDRGILIPRLSSQQRQELNNPANGLLVFDTDLKRFCFWNDSSTTWDVLTVGNSVWTKVDSVVSNGDGDYGSDVFVFGAPAIEHLADSNHQRRMLFNKSKAAFRAGLTYDDSWDVHNQGEASFATGASSRATGQASAALGTFTHANGLSSFATNYQTKAAASFSSALGNSTQANGYASTVIGIYNDTLAPINESGWLISENMPLFIVGNGGEVYEPNPPPGNFVTVRSNALTVWRNGRTALGNITPTEVLDVDGSIRLRAGAGSGKIAVSDAVGKLSWTNPAGLGEEIWTIDSAGVVSNGNGDYSTDVFVFGAPEMAAGLHGQATRMFFNKANGAFRAGTNGSAGWDPFLQGSHSIALGEHVVAYGDHSFSMGLSSVANGSRSAAIGHFTAATGFAAMAFGMDTRATNTATTAMGDSTRASGMSSTAMGRRTIANGFASTALGIFNDSLGTAQFNIVPSTPLFTVGNGDSDVSRSNALVVRKDGKVALGNITPTEVLDVNGSIRMRSGAADGYVAVSDTVGKVVWTHPFQLPDAIWAKTGSVISNENGSYASDDFVFGSPTTWYSGDIFHQKRMFFDKSKGAFRAGLSDDWADLDVGVASFAGGWYTEASADASVAFGIGSESSGVGALSAGQYSMATSDNAVALGYYSDATGLSATAIGSDNTASGDYSVALGRGAVASGFNSTALGEFTKATSNAAISMGFKTEATNHATTAMGAMTKAIGNRSTAMGESTWAVAPYSSSLGLHTRSYGFSCTTLGMYSDSVVTVQNSPSETSPLFIIGNGNSMADRSNAMLVRKDGTVGIGTNDPTAKITNAQLAVEGGHIAVSNNYGIFSMKSVGTGIDAGFDTGVSGELYLYSAGASRLVLNTTGQLILNNSHAEKAGGGAWLATSDRRLKQNIQPFEDGLDEVMAIKPARFNYNEKSGYDTTDVHVGVIAQELKEVAPYMVFTNENGGEDYLQVDNSAMTYMLINAVKELKEANDALQQQVLDLAGQVASLQNAQGTGEE